MLKMKKVIHVILACIFIYASHADKTYEQQTFPSTTIDPEATASVHYCPVIIITPSFQYADYGKQVNFSGVIEAKLEFPTDARWQKVRNGNVPHNLDLEDEKYSGSSGLPPAFLLINEADFDDVGYYRLQVKISTGWCSSSTVEIQHVYGILQYNASCTQSRECDERKQLRCSSTNTCLCHSAYYPYNQTCYRKYNLAVSLSTSSINISMIQFQWSHPSHSDLINDYTVSIRHNNGTTITSETVGNQTRYNYLNHFVPGYRYYFKIISNVKIPNPSEQFTEYREQSIVVAPLPSGPIQRQNSSFHPEKLHLKWEKPPNYTRVDYYSITISNPSSSYSSSSYSNELVTNHRFQPGTNYTVTFRSRSYSTYSQPHTEEFQTLRTPLLTITPYGWPDIPYLSDLVIQCTVVNNTDFPLTLETKWRRNQVDVNISDSKYTGSSLDVYKPKLIINRVDFDRDDNDVYQCAARNSEGWGTSERTLQIDVKGSIPFQHQCNRSKECLYNKPLTCTSQQCLCDSSHYHKEKTCYYISSLRAQSITMGSSTCGIAINWWPPSRDVELISGYEVFLEERRSGWRSLDKILVGNTTQYTTPCSLESGRLYQFFIRSKINLRDPMQEMSVDSSYTRDILEPRKPGKIISSLSNFSADGLHLVWEESDAFVNRYSVLIDGLRQVTLDSKPEIYWNRLLLPVTQYNVTITAISYGFVTNYPSYGSKESQPAANWIMTTELQYSGKAYMSYGDEDSVMTGDRVTSEKLRSPTTVFVGDGSSGGFNYVVVGSNGIIGLGENFNGESIHGMDSKFVKERQILCPFWADLASSDKIGKVYYNTYRRGKEGENVDGMFMEKADSIVKKHFKDFGDFQATWLVKVTWENMTLYGHKDKKVTFQCFLITDGDNTFAVINYMDINMAPIENFNISIGYRYKKDLFVKNSFTKQKGSFRMSFIPGNRGERGFWIYKMSEGVQSKRDEKLCFFWYSHNIEKQIHHGLANVLNAIECPCDQRLLRFDPRYAINRFDKINRILCYASMTLGTNVECCYDMYANVDQLGPLRRSVPLAGTVLQYNPFFQRYQYTNYDFNPRKLCCSSGHCNWYYEVRPIPRCYRRSPFQPGINFGDPHITTLDGMDYTFNGFGEYTMLSINTSTASFTLQARTELASSANGTTINATVFTAFVAEDHTGSKVQIEMARNKEDLVIKGNGLDLTNRFRNASYIFMKQNLTISWQNQSIVATFLKTLNTIKISLGKRFLICETLINEKYKGQTIGLMGNFDGNKTNDFILPNGTSLPENATNSERDIYYKFGQLWSVNDASLFQYDDELTFENYTHPEFVPMFTDEVDTGKLNEAKQKCGSNSSKACIADYLATGDIALAEISGKKDQVSKSDIKIIENEIPSITGNTTLFVEVDKEVEIKFNVSDDGKEKPKLTLQKYPSNFTLDDETSSARWLPQKNSIPEISIVAIDSHGAQSSSLEYQIIQCDGCGEHGDCDFENALRTENDKFHKALCVCHVGYSGDQCSQDTDACSQSPCPLGRNCTDLTPEEEERLGRGYNCSACPSGYKEVENKCQDINECTSASTNSCDGSKETCENTDGGYICNCLEGYRKLKDQCNDINECLEKSSGCEQECQNTPGSFNCSCVPGYMLNADKRTCRKTDLDLCKNFDKQCEYACSIIDGITQCICPSGYTLTDDGITCTDIDECKLETTPCDQDCTNRNGSFQCTCRPGFALSADRTTCSRCELPNYGVNCSQECKCGPGVDRCDPVSGCVCQSGWTGNNCDTDIDECQENPAICGNAMICNNTEGSYRCDCQNGFQLLDGKCQDIDECADDLLNDCPLETTRCVNTYGDYNCDCQQGFQYNGSSCEDVDECKLATDKCSQKCENTPGGYNCLCFFGFVLKDDRISCEEEKDSCSLYPDLNCTYGCKKIDEHKGVCFCESGYELQDNGTCTDIDECKTSSTCAHNCTNKIGSFECSCAIGYRLGNDGSSCTACNQDFYGENCEVPCRCGRGSKECNHITGCICNEGWKGYTCEEDINECQLDNTCTGDHEVCVNSPGSYRCDCVKGYENISGICQDINECEDSKTCHQLCFNTNGSYTCGCKSGYELTNSKDCIDIDECRKARCSRCSNWPGSFKCSCDDGYRLNLTTLNVCDNINECEEKTHNCSSNATCTDTEGAFNCSCHVGLEGNGFECTVCTGFHYGEQCSEECTCNRTNSEGCDAVTGKCYCKAGWTGSDCAQDVDECATSNRTCDESSYQTCENKVGSFKCDCIYGGVNITNCTRPLPPTPINDTSAKVKAEVRFDLKINKSAFLRESENLRFQFETQLKTYHKKEISGISSLVVLSIRYGSVYVEYEIVGPARFEKNVATVISKMFRGDIKLKISNYGLVNVLQVTIKDENGGENSFTSGDNVRPCSFLKHMGDCPTGYYCEDSSSRAECIKVKSDFSVIAIITISAGVGVPLLITIIVMVLVWKRVTKKTSKENHKSLSGDMTEYIGKIPRPSHCNEYDYIPSDAIPRYVCSKDIGRIEREPNWDSLSEKLGQQEFRIQRPNIHRTKTDKYMY